MDATYKTTAYDLPLFFLAVKTNCDYQIVATFITEDEHTNTIAEALTILKDNCLDISPPYFLTDFDESEISAIEKVFPGINQEMSILPPRPKQIHTYFCNLHTGYFGDNPNKKKNDLNEAVQ